MENMDEDASESCTARDVGDIVEDGTRGETDSRADTGADVSPVAEEEPPDEAQVVPVWEPDAQQEDRPATATATATAPAQAAPREKRDNNVNEVCPWEDE